MPASLLVPRRCHRLAAASFAAGLLLAAAIGARADDTPPDIAADIATANEHRQMGRYAEAVEAYQQLSQVAELAPAERTAIAIGLSQALEETGAWTVAMQTLRAARERPDAAARVWSRLAELEYRQGRYDDASLHVVTALALDADDPRAHLVQAHLARETGRFDDALRDYQWCVRYYNRGQPKDADTLLVIAEGSLEYARWKRVTNIFDFVVNTLCPDALRADPACWQAHWLAGGLLLEKYNQSQARPALHKALAINAQAAPALAELAAAHLQEMQFEQAEEQADRALAVNPRLPAALLIKTDLALLAGESAAAREFVARALAVNPADQRIRAREALCCLLEDGLPDAAEVLEVFLHLDAIDRLELPQPSRFSQVLIDVAHTNPRPGVFLTLVGEGLDARRRYDDAERFYRHAINVMPQLAAPRTSLGMLCMQTGQIDEAQRILDEAFRVDPFHVRVSNMRKVLGVLRTYDTLASDHFVIRSDAANRLLAGYMSEYLESIYAELTERYDYEPPTRTQFELYSAAKGQSAHEWFSARMIGLPWIQTIGASTGKIVALASPTDREPFNWARVVRHEFVHILTLQETGFHIPHWYTEALAVGEEGLDMPEDWQKLLLERVPAGDVFTLATINSGFQRPDDATDWTMAYCQSHLYAKYLVREFGDDALIRLLGAYRRHLSTAEAIPGVFGRSIDEFEAGYRDYLSETTAAIGSQRAPRRAALPAARAAWEAAPEDPAAIGPYALALLAGRNVKDAREQALRAYELDASQPEAAYVLARIAMTYDDNPRAVELLSGALDEASPHAEVLDQLGDLRLDAGEHTEAARLFELGTQNWPLEDRFWVGLAISLWRLGDTDRLRPVLETVAARQYDNASVRRKLSEIALSESRFDEAARWGRDAIYIDVLDAAAHHTLAQAYESLENVPQALREYTAVTQLDVKNIPARLGLARMLIASGQGADAVPHLEVILEKEPDNAEARSLLDQVP